MEVTCATIDDFMTFVLPTCRALDTIPGRIFYFQMRFTDLHGGHVLDDR